MMMMSQRKQWTKMTNDITNNQEDVTCQSICIQFSEKVSYLAGIMNL